MVRMSPVDTGRFRSNWQSGFGSANIDTGSPENSDAIGRASAALESWKPGQTIWLTNSLPYSRALEYGHSKQAPGGMVRLTIQNYAAFLENAVKGMS
jgi:hypothetical protein